MKKFSDIFPPKHSIAGIGSRAITNSESRLLMLATVIMIYSGYRFNSGAASGSDTSVEFAAKLAYDIAVEKLGVEFNGYKDVMSVFLPWNGFNGRFVDRENGYIVPNHPSAREIAKRHYSIWDHSKDSVKTMMARNVHQVLDEDLDKKVQFVFCHTTDGVNDGSKTTDETGGTGQAIRLASHYGIPVFNMGNESDKIRLLKWIEVEKIRIMEKFGIDVEFEIDNAIKNYLPFKNIIKNNDLLTFAENGGAGLLINDTNCHHEIKSELYRQICKKYPAARSADLATKKGELKKLGTYSHVDVAHKDHLFSIVNAYIHRKSTKNKNLFLDYDDVRKALSKINSDFYGKSVALSGIGMGSNACWISIANTIKTELRNTNMYFVDSDRSLKYINEINQVEFDL